MAATILKWIVIGLALLNAGYMAFDGSRALIKGDYVRPSSGEYAGQLGPWSKLAEKVGIDPMSALMKCIFLVWGVAGSIITICFAMGFRWAWKAMLVYDISCCWNLMFGTASSILQIVLLVIIRFLG